MELVPNAKFLNDDKGGNAKTLDAHSQPLTSLENFGAFMSDYKQSQKDLDFLNEIKNNPNKKTGLIMLQIIMRMIVREVPYFQHLQSLIVI